MLLKIIYLSENPLKNMPLYKIDQLPPRFLSKEETKRVLDASKGEPLESMIRTAIYTGMRLGELKRLKSADVSKGSIMVKISKSKRF